jgi:predicted anti-sigma-YlaC factor YlaD
MLRKIVLTCEEVTRICSDELERPLKRREQASLYLHMKVCTGCKHYRQQLGILSRAMHTYAEGDAPSSSGN